MKGNLQLVDTMYYLVNNHHFDVTGVDSTSERETIVLLRVVAVDVCHSIVGIALCGGIDSCK